MTSTLVNDLQKWVAHNDYHVAAAVRLLIEHDYWLRNGRFVRAAVVKAVDGQYISWSRARLAFDAGEFDRSSTSEVAVLNLAIMLGGDEMHLSSLGKVNGAIAARAVAAALGVDGGAR
jgi:hypothetical protein